MSTHDFAAFASLDLAPIKMKLMHEEFGEGWTAPRADAVEAEYRRFLFLMKKYPNAEASPTVDVDTFWHYHILDTLKYAHDCESLFGYFLHHYPYVGMGAAANDGDHAAGGERMRAIYQAEFGAWPAANADAFCTSPGRPADAATAFCTSPGQPLAASAEAFCTSPGKPASAQAFCTSPGKPAGAQAFCTSPGKQLRKAVGAFCTSPGKRFGSASAANAHTFCTSPGDALGLSATAAAAHAFCTSPGKQPHAFCTSPGKQLQAFCTSPGTPREAANAAHAFCTSPGKRADAGQDLAIAA